MRDQDLVWPFSTSRLSKRWNKEVVSGNATDRIGSAIEIASVLFAEVERLRKKLKATKERHYEDAGFLCDEVYRLRHALQIIKRTAPNGDSIVSSAFEQLRQKEEPAGGSCGA